MGERCGWFFVMGNCPGLATAESDGGEKKKAQCWMIRVLVLPFLSFPFLEKCGIGRGKRFIVGLVDGWMIWGELEVVVMMSVMLKEERWP